MYELLFIAYDRGTKIIINAFLLTSVLTLTGCFKADDVLTTVIQNKNGIIYAYNSDEPFIGKYVSSYYKNGQKKNELNFTDGKIDGLVTEWYENGQKKYEGNWNDGSQDGLATIWYEN